MFRQQYLHSRPDGFPVVAMEALQGFAVDAELPVQIQPNDLPAGVVYTRSDKALL